MTIFLVLGLVAGLHMLGLLFRMAVHALPVYAGLGTGLWLHGAGQGYLLPILAGFLTAAVILALGRILFGSVRSPALRCAVAAVFAIPAGIAGYQSVRAVAGLALGPGMVLTLISGAGAILIASGALGSIAAIRRSSSS
tara:strand:- start:496 stop:912 length:417 start_codon:yes stop_codon:yes gene_type:complete